MKYRMYMGVAILVFLFIGFFAFLLTQPPKNGPEEIYRAPTPSEQAEVDRNIQDTIDKAKQKDPPIAEDDHDHPHPHVHEPMKRTPKPVAKSKTELVRYDKPLAYDAELLEKNPALALKRELEARGHWAAEHIPPFPPDDLEAQEIARYEYMLTFMNIQDAEKLWDIVLKHDALMTRAIKEYGIATARSTDLLRLGWGSYSSPYEKTPDFDSMNYPSEYFTND